ncbi:MAG: tRNA pseudouridine(13) synthase TruD [Candidatus Odinarchaeum yellowstonii]|uniref:Probable tRNA pseudouridine synthase D n=1 Tax=Odinarchaeota yellowstonii (strain LCB_4) TaxID=1841599 RepID=A0AAF0D111_ODILC|nr:MAG: tRNA pseudouridine(13) synthase TruD [Candidatus Odinarchaeum yellowstonii]
MFVPEYEYNIGMRFYATSGNGLKGRIRASLSDFIVEEIDKNGVRWPVKGDVRRLSNRSRFLHFTLVKEGYDTPSAIRVISKRTGIPAKFFSYAGLKDKLAKTAQRVSIPVKFMERLRTFQHGMIKIKDLTFSDRNIGLGDLSGNSFRIKIVLSSDNEDVKSKLNLIREEILELGGIPNFYGHQRFGTIRCVNHQIGKLLLERRFEDAVKLFLTFKSDFESEDSKLFRNGVLNLLEDGVNGEVADHLFYEYMIVKYLKKHPGDYKGCFLSLPKNISRLFLHSYQSYIFNLTLSERWSRGLPLNEAVSGDIIFEGVKGYPRYRRVSNSELPEINRNIKSQRYRVVLPVVGYDSKLPSGEAGECVLKVLESERVNLEDFHIPEVQNLSSAGDYRGVLAPVYNFKIKYYSKKNIAWLSFTLEKGCYATVLIREFLKNSDFYQVGY